MQVTATEYRNLIDHCWDSRNGIYAAVGKEKPAAIERLRVTLEELAAAKPIRKMSKYDLDRAETVRKDCEAVIESAERNLLTQKDKAQ